MFVYDIFLTFPLEVEKVWKRRITGLTVLWFLVCSLLEIFCEVAIEKFVCAQAAGAARPSFASALLEDSKDPDREYLIKMASASMYAGT